MSDDRRIPRFSADLVEYLDGAISDPELPNTAAGFSGMNEATLRQLAFTKGARALVDFLVSWVEAEEDDDTDEAVDDESVIRFPQVFGTDGEVREIEPPLSVD